MAKRQPIQRVVYPVQDHMGEHEIQRLIAELLRPLLARFLARKGIVAHAGADQFIYWAEGNPTKRLAPDVYVLPGVDQDIVIPSWKTWETGIVPSFALEIAGNDVSKDYEDGPVEYADLGVEELVVFDPRATWTSRTRVRWQIFHRIEGQGFVRVEASQADRVRSKVLDAWLLAVGSGDGARIRIGEGPTGDTVFPTEAEEARAAEEKERALRLQAEAEVERLRALLDAMKR
jgi:hypothetical protein